MDVADLEEVNENGGYVGGILQVLQEGEDEEEKAIGNSITLTTQPGTWYSPSGPNPVSITIRTFNLS